MEHYSITLDSPLGPKQGTLAVEGCGARVTGALSILRQDNPFTGERLENGQIRILHELRTAFSTLPGEALLSFDRDHVTGSVNAGGKAFAVSGVKMDAENRANGG